MFADIVLEQCENGFDAALQKRQSHTICSNFNPRARRVCNANCSVEIDPEISKAISTIAVLLGDRPAANLPRPSRLHPRFQPRTCVPGIVESMVCNKGHVFILSTKGRDTPERVG